MNLRTVLIYAAFTVFAVAGIAYGIAREIAIWTR